MRKAKGKRSSSYGMPCNCPGSGDSKRMPCCLELLEGTSLTIAFSEQAKGSPVRRQPALRSDRTVITVVAWQMSRLWVGRGNERRSQMKAGVVVAVNNS